VQGEHHNHECHASRTIKKDAGLDAELDIAKADIYADIRKFGVINLEDKARCVRSFMDSILAAGDDFGNLNVLKNKASTRTSLHVKCSCWQRRGVITLP